MGSSAIHIGRRGVDYQDPHTNADTFARNPDNSDDAATRPLAWRNARDIATMPGIAIFVVSPGFNLLGGRPTRCARPEGPQMSVHLAPNTSAGGSRRGRRC